MINEPLSAGTITISLIVFALPWIIVLIVGILQHINRKKEIEEKEKIVKILFEINNKLNDVNIKKKIIEN